MPEARQKGNWAIREYTAVDLFPSPVFPVCAAADECRVASGSAVFVPVFHVVSSLGFIITPGPTHADRRSIHEQDT